MISRIVKHFHKFFIFLSLSFFLVLTACQTVPVQSTLMEETQITDLSTYELRVKINHFAPRFASTVESTANIIAKSARDVDIEVNSLLWKMYSIPALQKAIFTDDPLAAAIDTWAFCAQMVQFFEKGKGKNLFGQYQPLAINASKKLKNEMQELFDSITFNDTLKNRGELLKKWVEENPIENKYFMRRSTNEILSKFTGKAYGGFTSTLGHIAQDIDALSMKLDTYADQIPKQARWQAEYLLVSLKDHPRYSKDFENLTRLFNNVDSLTRFVENLPAFLDSVPVKANVSISKIQEETINDLHGEIEVLLGVLRKERLETLDAISEERDAALNQAHDIAGQLLGKGRNEADLLINKIFWRGAVLILFLFILTAAAIYFFRYKPKQKIQV